MKANYHTHTWRCNHAAGTEEEYVQAAISRGLQTLGFSDHTPYFFPGDYYSTFRMEMNQLDGYIQCIADLREKYKSDISILTGLEAEFYPDLFPALLSRLQESEISYLILGQHIVGNEINEHYSGRATDDVHILKRYAHQVMEAINTGLFTYIAHPDLFNYTGSTQNYRSIMLEMCTEAKQCSIPLEYNLLGLATNRNYPNPLFWEIAAEVGNTVVLGIDAHMPSALEDLAPEEKALEQLKKLGIEPVEVARLLPIR